MNVQGYILCLSVVTTVEEVRERLEGGILHDVEEVFHLDEDSDVTYTAPKWIIAEDIVFFYHTKTSISKIKSLRRKIKKQCAQDSDFNELLNFVDESERLYDKYGGKIYAVGKVADRPFECDESDYEHPHFRSRIFAPISDVSELQYPIPLERFEEVCPLGRRQTITGVFGNAFNELKKMIIRYNDVPCLKGKTALHIPLKEADNGNWLAVANECNRRYILEAQFRKYYADYFLSCMSDDGEIYTECGCFKNGKRTGIADYFILVKGKYVPVETKISFMAEWDIIELVEKYCNCDSVKLSRGLEITDKEKISQDKCYVIDTEYFLWYSYDENRKEEVLYEIAKLKDIKSMADIRRIKSKL